MPEKNGKSIITEGVTIKGGVIPKNNGQRPEPPKPQNKDAANSAAKQSDDSSKKS